MNKSLFSIYIITLFYVFPISAQDFSYENTDDWSKDFPDCGGSHQSPIALDTQKFKLTGKSETLQWIGYDKVPVKVTLTNTGHQLQVLPTFNDDEVPYITGAIVDNNSYAFEKMEFHWSNNDDSTGSEHNYDGKGSCVEGQLVHYNKKYNSYDDALEHSDGLAIVAILFNEDNVSREFTPLNDHIPDVIEPESSIDIEPFAFSALEQPLINGTFITYSGSLTAPPCTEVVTWILPNHTFGLNRKQLDKLKMIKLSNGDDHNNRPVNPLNDRSVYLWAECITCNDGDDNL